MFLRIKSEMNQVFMSYNVTGEIMQSDGGTCLLQGKTEKLSITGFFFF